MFDVRNSPALCIFTGEKVWGTSAPRYMKVPPETARVEIPVHAVLAQHLRTGLLNRGAQLKNLFTFDSDTLRGGTGELRSWISAAGACQWPATVVDYVPAHHVKAGLGFAYWPPRAA